MGYKIADSLNDTWTTSGVKDLTHAKTPEEFKDFVLALFNEAGV